MRLDELIEPNIVDIRVQIEKVAYKPGDNIVPAHQRRATVKCMDVRPSGNILC